jgi:hypothetical protein
MEERERNPRTLPDGVYLVYSRGRTLASAIRNGNGNYFGYHVLDIKYERGLYEVEMYVWFPELSPSAQKEEGNLGLMSSLRRWLMG